jgi:predicted RNA polymerase sigma factor
MVPLSEQDPKLWRRPLIAEGDALLRAAARLNRPGSRQLRAALHGVWCVRRSLDEPPPWSAALALYDLLLAWREDPFVRINRAVVLAEIAGPAATLAEIEGWTLRDWTASSPSTPYGRTSWRVWDGGMRRWPPMTERGHGARTRGAALVTP